ncbi:MAG: hypothetical protein HZB16_06510 [Armatimonadetes bacterium]|nr:hypothetical protein [Armatimonadota bacterium]
MRRDLTDLDVAQSRAKMYLARSVVVYGLILAAVEVAIRSSYRHSLPQLRFLGAPRVHALVEAHCAEDLVFRVAYLSLPLLTLVLAARLNTADPLGELGLRGWRVVRDLVIGLALGTLAYHVVWMTLAALSGTPSAWGGYLLWLAAEGEYWREPKGLALLALGLCYAMGRSIVPFGHCLYRAEHAWGTARAAVFVAAVFALPHLASTYVSPLCLFNLLLAGGALALVRLRGGSLGWALGLLAGWTAVERMADLALSDSSLEHAYAASLPPIISGGFSGVSGSLVVTLALCGWLACLLRPARRSAASVPEPTAQAPEEEEARPEGLEPPTP